MEPGLIGGLTISGFLLAAWNTIKMYLTKAYALAVVKVTVNSSLEQIMTWYFSTHFKRSRFSTLKYFASHQYVRPLKKNQSVGYRNLPDDASFYWKDSKVILLSMTSKDSGMNFSFIRGTFDPDELIADAIEKYNAMHGDGNIERDRFYVRKYSGTLSKMSHNGNVSGQTEENSKEAIESPQNSEGATPLKWSIDELGLPKRKDPFESVALSKECSLALSEARLWKKSETWHKERLLPWKRGWLLYGAPGNGKTSFVRALAQDLNMPINVFNLSHMSNDDFESAWRRTLENAPCIALIEDIDAVFDGRKNIINPQMGITFDFILNSIDGIENSDGVFLIITTNNIDKIDPAIGQVVKSDISTRPGRIDRSIFVDNPDKAGKEKIANRILSDYPEKIKNIIIEGENDTGAQFQERCSRLALNMFWEKNNAIIEQGVINIKK